MDFLLSASETLLVYALWARVQEIGCEEFDAMVVGLVTRIKEIGR